MPTDDAIDQQKVQVVLRPAERAETRNWPFLQAETNREIALLRFA
jgi:hypothetical protein